MKATRIVDLVCHTHRKLFPLGCRLDRPENVPVKLRDIQIGNRPDFIDADQSLFAYGWLILTFRCVQVQTVQTKKGQHEIPVPDVNIVESYETDVKPNYVQHESY
eukprot:3776248-Pyramimonas_sp.AAC.1